MNEIFRKLRLVATTFTAIAGAILVVGMGVSGKLNPPSIDGSFSIEADILMSPNSEDKN